MSKINWIGLYKDEVKIEIQFRKLRIIINDIITAKQKGNKMENTEVNKSLAQQLVDEYYGNYEQTKPSEAELPSILSIVEFMLDKYHLGISIEPLIMTTERIKEIQKTTPYPDSISVQQALLQVWNEVAQESNHQMHGVVVTNEAVGEHLTDKEFETLSVRITPAFYDIDLDGATNCKGDVLRKLRIIFNDIIDSRKHYKDGIPIIASLKESE